MANKFLKTKKIEASIWGFMFSAKTQLEISERLRKSLSELKSKEFDFTKIEFVKAEIKPVPSTILWVIEKAKGYGKIHDPDVSGTAKGKLMIDMSNFELIETIDVKGDSTDGSWDEVELEKQMLAYDNLSLEKAVDLFFDVLEAKRKELRSHKRWDGCGSNWSIDYDQKHLDAFFKVFTKEFVLNALAD